MFVKFFYTIRNRELLEEECSVLVDSKTVNIIGERVEMIYLDGPRAGYMQIKALFINYNGIEYASENMSVAEFRSLISCPPTVDDFQLHEAVYEDLYE